MVGCCCAAGADACLVHVAQSAADQIRTILVQPPAAQNHCAHLLLPASLRACVAPCRLLACFGLLIVGRVVNIALPIAYKKVIDRLADTSAAAAAAAAANVGGRAALCAAFLRAAQPTFRDVFLPWVAVYLTLVFLQASRGGRRLESVLLAWEPSCCTLGPCCPGLAGC